MPMIIKGLGEAGALLSASESGQIRSGLVLLESGKEVGEHETGNGEELITVLEGSAEVECEGETRLVHAPAVVLIPAHSRHNVRNASKEPLRYVYSYVAALDGS
jgi:quercetin dioxygenase-like cupin family protein